jgi:hypothetical protein
MPRNFSTRAVQRRANDRAEDKAHDERVWEAERKRLAAEAEAKAQADETAASQPSLDEVTGAEQPITMCAAGRDGECAHVRCPQLRDNEPGATGRHCPLDNNTED